MSNEENAADRGVTEDHEENLQEGEETQDTRLCHPPSTAYCQACSTRGAAPQRRWCKGRFHRRCPEYVSLYILDAAFRKMFQEPSTLKPCFSWSGSLLQSTWHHIVFKNFQSWKKPEAPHCIFPGARREADQIEQCLNVISFNLKFEESSWMIKAARQWKLF